jgi:hypothetical protein
MNKKLILILCEPRTGSNLLCEAMESYVDLQCINEFYLSPYINLYVKENQIPDDLPHKRLTQQQQDKLFTFLNVENSDYFNLLVSIYKQPIESLVELYNATDKTLVVKIMHKHFKDLSLDKLLDLPFVEVIVLDRSNKLEEYVSHRKAIEFNKWYNADTSDLKITVDIDKFLERNHLSLDWYKQIRLMLSNKHYLELNYENDLQHFDHDEFCKMFDSWLLKIGVDIKKTKHKMKFFKKQNNSSVKNSILNYDDIVNRLNT